MPSLLYLGVCLTAMSTLMVEVLLTRITSVIAWYHLSFFIISLAMLGMTAGAVIVYLHRARFPPARLYQRLAQTALAYGLVAPLAVGALMARPLPPVTGLGSLLSLALSGVLIAVPFALGGITLTLALTRSPLPVSRVYAADLCGAALGCALVVALLEVLDAPSAVLFAGAVGCLAGACLAAAGGRPTRWPLLAALGLVAATLLNSAAPSPPYRPTWVKGFQESLSHYAEVRWNSHSRITLGHAVEVPPMFWAKGRLTPDAVLTPRPQRALLIDGGAATTMTALGDAPSDHRYLAWDVSTFAHRLRPRGPAAVIGVGGGRDILAALQSGHRPVVGIEVNPDIVGLHRGHYRSFSGLADLEGVELHTAEARSFLTREPRTFSVIAMSLIDTWAATGAGAYSLSENGLYTRQAWNRFIDRLQPDGVLSVSRWYVVGSPGETARMLVLAFDTLFSRGIERPRDHVIMAQSERVATLLLSPSPWPDAAIDLAQQEASKRGYNLLHTPRRLPIHPLLRRLATQESREALAHTAATQRLDLTAPTDDRPFFFNMLKPGTWLGKTPVSRLDLPGLGNLQATQTLVYATLISLALALLALVLPLGRARTTQSLSSAALSAALAYFALIGLGFMTIEMALLSRLNVFLGHPALSLPVLLGGLIFFAGLGSLASERLPAANRWVRRLAPVAPAAFACLAALSPEAWLTGLAGATTGARVAVSLACIAPLALCMGVAFPLGLRWVAMAEGQPQGDPPALGPWLWGLNGAFSVCASGLALGLSMTFGIGVTFAVGGLCYLLLPLTVWCLPARPSSG